MVKMVKKTGIQGIGNLISDSPTSTPSTGSKHPGRLNLILRKKDYPKTITRYGDWFGDDVSEEEVYCGFFGCNEVDSTNTKRDKLFSFIHMVSSGKLQVTPVESED